MLGSVLPYWSLQSEPFGISFPTSVQHGTWMHKLPPTTSAMTNLLVVFDNATWIGLLMTLIFLSLMFGLLEILNATKRRVILE